MKPFLKKKRFWVIVMALVGGAVGLTLTQQELIVELITIVMGG